MVKILSKKTIGVLALVVVGFYFGYKYLGKSKTSKTSHALMQNSNPQHLSEEQTVRSHNAHEQFQSEDQHDQAHNQTLEETYEEMNQHGNPTSLNSLSVQEE